MSVLADEDNTFNKLLDEYKSNYVQYVSTGSQDYKRAYENARNAIQAMISKKQETVDKERADMKHFVGAYKKDGESLGKLQDKAGDMYTNAQKIQDRYETSKKRYDNWLNNEEPSQVIDYTNGYGIVWRMGLAILLLLFVFGLSFYNPNVLNRSWGWGNGYGAGTTISIPSFGSPVPGTPVPGTPVPGTPVPGTPVFGIPGTPRSPASGVSITMSPAWGRR